MNKFLKQEWPLLAILLLTFLAAAAVYPMMPDQVPIHWNAAGQVDGYGSRAFGAFFLPVMNLGIYVLFLVLPKLDPRKENYAKFGSSYRFIRYTFHFFMVYIFVITLLASLGYGVSIDRLVPIGVALLFIVLGNYMGKIRHNYFVGFAFPGPWPMRKYGKRPINSVPKPWSSAEFWHFCPFWYRMEPFVSPCS